MCGRYLLTTPVDALGQLFRFMERPNLGPRYNIAPTQDVPIVRRTRAGDRRELLHGALGPRALLGGRREDRQPPDQRPRRDDRAHARVPRGLSSGGAAWCRPTVSSNGARQGKTRQPLLIRRKDQAPFAFAGLWERWRQPDGQILRSCTIVTCPANALVAPVHDRMPVILDPGDFERWLDPEAADGARRCSGPARPTGSRPTRSARGSTARPTTIRSASRRSPRPRPNSAACSKRVPFVIELSHYCRCASGISNLR